MRQDQTYSPYFYINAFTTTVSIICSGPSHALAFPLPVVRNLVSAQFVLIARDLSTKFYNNPFTTRVLIVIDPSHTLVYYELSGSNDAHTRHDQTYIFHKFYINPFATRVLVFIGSSQICPSPIHSCKSRHPLHRASLIHRC